MLYNDRARLLDPKPMALEMGFERNPDGALHVAIRTDMHGCSGAMFDWWFSDLRPGTREYRWWHPLDHIASDWIETSPHTAIGSIHQVRECFTGGEPQSLSIQFYDPHEIFDAGALAAARQAGAVSGLVCARGGAGHEPKRTPDGAVVGTRLIHLARDTPWGMVLRTHFFMGQDLANMGMPPAEIAKIFVDMMGPGLLQHCYDEFTFLSRFLPSLYAAEGPQPEKTPRPW